MYIIVFDDEQGLCIPYGWDADCEGAVCATSRGNKVVIFTDRKAAQKAIKISARHAELRLAQGKPSNGDFLGKCRKHVRIMACVQNTTGQGPAAKGDSHAK